MQQGNDRDTADGLDAQFLIGLRRLMNTGAEAEIHRRGFQGSNYSLHGVIVAVHNSGRIDIRRTRSHQGEVHTMDSRYMFRATVPGVETVANRTALAREILYRQREDQRVQQREETLRRAVEDASWMPEEPEGPTRIVSRHPRTDGGLDCEVVSACAVRAHVVASSERGAEKVLRCLEIFMPLESLVPIALGAGFLWPRTWNEAWSLPADSHDPGPMRDRTQLDQLASLMRGLPHEVFRWLMAHLQRHHGSVDPSKLNAEERAMLTANGLLTEVPRPTFRQALECVHLHDLRAIVQTLGTGVKARHSAVLRQHIVEHLTPQVSEEVYMLSRYPRHALVLPPATSASLLHHQYGQYRFMLHALRKWLHFEEDITAGAPATASK